METEDFPYRGACQTKAHLTGSGEGLSSRERRSRVRAETLKKLWSEHFGLPWPEDKWALHFCDNSRCSNPEHIFPGTPSDNLADAYGKGRKESGFGIGEEHHNAKLSLDDVIAIRERVGRGESQSQLALEFGVHPPAISRIVSGQRWGWL